MRKIGTICNLHRDTFTASSPNLPLYNQFQQKFLLSWTNDKTNLNHYSTEKNTGTGMDIFDNAEDSSFFGDSLLADNLHVVLKIILSLIVQLLMIVQWLMRSERQPLLHKYSQFWQFSKQEVLQNILSLN